MRELEFPFNRSGFCYEPIDRTGMVCLVRVTRFPPFKAWCYEVVRLKIEPDKTFPNGYFTPEHEAYPSSEEWGENAFTYRPAQLEAAQNRCEQLQKSQVDAPAIESSGQCELIARLL